MKTLTKALGLPCAALIAFTTTATPAMAQDNEGDNEITVSMNVVDGPNPDAVQVNVIKVPDLGEIVRPRGAVRCSYAVFSTGGTSVFAREVDFNTGVPTPVANSGCEFLSGVTAPEIQITCEEGRQISLFGSLNDSSTNISAQIGSGGSTGGNAVTCEASAFSVEPAISVELNSSSELGTQALTVPFEVTFE